MIKRLLPYALQGVAVGIIAGFILMYFSSSDAPQQTANVEITQAAPIPSIAPSGDVISYADAVELAAPAVVNIYTTKTIRQQHPFFDDPAFRRFFEEFSPFRDRTRRENSLGSGVIVSKQGYILTNNHVIDGADEIQVALYDGRNTIAQVAGNDPESDLAVLKINLPDLPAITLGHSESLRVGDVVLAIGNPFGVGQTVTQGIVSATHRSHLGISTFENFIQTDAAINPGNSGGALINPYGHLIGINTAIFSRSGGSQGIGFAIPMSLAQGVLEQIINSGQVVRGWLGIEIQQLTPTLAESFGLSNMNGIIIAGVLSNGPAAKANLRAGDIIIKVDDEVVTSPNQTINLIARHSPGEKVKLTLWRQGEEIDMAVEVGIRPKFEKR